MSFRFAALLATALTALCCTAVFAAAPAAAGPLQQSDRALLTQLKQAELWEGPASRIALQRASADKVRTVAGTISGDQADLDTQLTGLADRLGLTLPDQPTPEQQSWVDQLRADTGTALDTAYVNRLRAGYGTIFGLASQVRAGTQDDDVRTFAQTVVDLALRHMTLLEGTGLAESTSLLITPAADNTLGGGDVALGAILVALATVVTFGLVRLLGTPRHS